MGTNRTGGGWLNSLGHERYINGLFVQRGGHFGGLRYIPAVHQPEAGADSGGEVDTVIDEGEGGAAGDIFPLGACSST